MNIRIDKRIKLYQCFIRLNYETYTHLKAMEKLNAEILQGADQSKFHQANEFEDFKKSISKVSECHGLNVLDYVNNYPYSNKNFESLNRNESGLIFLKANKWINQIKAKKENFFFLEATFSIKESNPILSTREVHLNGSSYYGSTSSALSLSTFTK